ncbi:AAA family ATPase [Bacillus suaedaesalsae]|uniref:AAA family ATPase n=1 Tax=Bacillus suaedaesalsae TaxID=2810349 RepID=A0ABS2DEV6_9BACI|nr:AAA family ATPase [Bacillus suaedaesalsae]MBM6616986.1 AAA family ATPase [Bacillus suaedaesalsae]
MAKPTQWAIDRNFNFTRDKQEKIKDFLTIYKELKADQSNFEEIRLSLVEKGIIVARENALKQSVLTGYRSHGLVAGDFVTEVAKLYLDEELTYDELFILQLFKKQYKQAESYHIRPLMVTLLVLSLLNEKNPRLSWIDAYDYFEYLIKIKDYSEINEQLINDIITKKQQMSPTERRLREITDYDIWQNLFTTLSLFNNIENGYQRAFRLNENAKPLIEFLLINHDKAALCLEKRDWGNYYGALDGGLMDTLPAVELGTINIPEILKEYHGELLREFLFDKGSSFRKIESDVFPGFDNESPMQGFLSKYIIDSYGLKKEHKGIFEPFIGLENLLLLNKDYQHLNHIFRTIFPDRFDGITYEIKEETDMVAENTIIYGAPGTGKSHTVRKKYEIPVDMETSRVTFHPEYTYNDFIGYIKPIVKNETISYEFYPGPFTKILRDAHLNKHKKYSLIIEEINRANAPAVFGDVFQLLDRNENGESTYHITNADIAKYVFNDSNREIIIPNNLNIIATMNTSDQNVFIMDTAFKRRWGFEFLPINFEECKYKDETIAGTSVSWRQFGEGLNKFLMDVNSENVFISEDKLVGPWFISENDIKDNEKFAYKMIAYLWDDVLKHDRNILFKDHLKTLFETIHAFKTMGINDVFKEVFLGYLFVDANKDDEEMTEDVQ